ncbi:MAG: 4Fe-4S dicluster domain-containing protein [Chlorobium sp.]|nr:4Fe-4S dicluster domain-containing protein [Chlorobium sp.]
MADPVQKPDISSKPVAKVPPAEPKMPPVAPKMPPAAPKMPPVSPKAANPAAKQEVKAKPKELSPKQGGKLRLEPINVNLGRSGLPQESAFPFKKEVKAAPKPAPVAASKPVAGAKPVPGQKPAAPASKGAPIAEAAPAPAPVAPPASGAPVKKAAPREKDHYFIIENLCVGCGLCLDKCPPKVQAIGYKFYGDVQEGGFRAYIDQDACISCSACFNADECPSGALIEVHPDGEIIDYVYTPPERLDFDLRFLHRFHKEVR